MNQPVEKHDPYLAFRYRDYRLLLGGSLLANIGSTMQSVAVGWELYQRTNSAMALGWVGLIQALPIIVFSIPAGHVADIADRKTVVMMARCIIAAASIGLAVLSILHGSIAGMYGCLLVAAVAQAFNGAAGSALLPQIVPREVFNNALTWKSSSFQLASMAGPALGGLLLATGPASRVYIVDAAFSFIFAIFAGLIQHRRADVAREKTTLRTLVAGFHYVWKTKIILAAITLDLFAVLFGGATALMPIFARDILHAGAVGLGWLRAAPAVGAFLMALVLAHRRPFARMGDAMLWSVAAFGLATIVFGLSHSFWLSLLMLLLTGAFDNISVVVRHNLVQLGTPDHMRGRVSAVNNVFISSSNELGAFESGLVAAWLGAIRSVVIGGIGTIIVVLWSARIWPEIRALRTLDTLQPFDDSDAKDA